MNMRLRILLPGAIAADEAAVKMTANGLQGSFTLLPRHVDVLVVLVPGLLSWQPLRGEERFAAVDAGLLIKYGQEVLVSTRRAVLGADLGTLHDTIRQEFLAIDEHERQARTVTARLEAGFVRGFLEMETRARA